MVEGRLQNTGITLDPDNLPDNLKTDTTGTGGDYSVKVGLTKNSKAMGDAILIEIVEQDEDRFHNQGIYIPEAARTNQGLTKGKVISVGPKARKRINLDEGELVLYDRLSTFYSPPEIPGTLVVTKVENVICVVND